MKQNLRLNKQNGATLACLWEAYYQVFSVTSLAKRDFNRQQFLELVAICYKSIIASSKN